jgi:hypothetical protein
MSEITSVSNSFLDYKQDIPKLDSKSNGRWTK